MSNELVHEQDPSQVEKIQEMLHDSDQESKRERLKNELQDSIRKDHTFCKIALTGSKRFAMDSRGFVWSYMVAHKNWGLLRNVRRVNTGESQRDLQAKYRFVDIDCEDNTIAAVDKEGEWWEYQHANATDQGCWIRMPNERQDV